MTTTIMMQPGVLKYADQNFNHVRNASSSSGQMPSINTGSSTGNEGLNAYYTNQHNVIANQMTQLGEGINGAMSYHHAMMMPGGRGDNPHH
jgi:hypothetical protein